MPNEVSMDEKLRLTKMLHAFTRLMDTERKRILLAHDRLKEMGEEIERIVDCLYDSEDALSDAVSNFELGHDRLAAALYGEATTDEEENEGTEGFAEAEGAEETEGTEEAEVVEVDEVESDEGTAHIPYTEAPIGGP